jgi:hypothetical protein
VTQGLGGLDLSSILDTVVDWRYKGFPPARGNRQVTVGTIRDQGWDTRGGDLLFPLIVVKESALARYIDLMASNRKETAPSGFPSAPV